MARLRSILPFSFVAVTLAGCPAYEPVFGDTNNVPSAEQPEDFGSWLSVATTPDGTRPIAAYYDRSQGDGPNKGALGFAIGTVADDGAVSWYFERVDGYSGSGRPDPGNRGRFASMAVGADGSVWIAYHDTSAGKLRFARRLRGPRDPEQEIWVTGDIDAGPGVGTWVDLALTEDGSLPIVSYHDDTNGALKVARLDADPGYEADATYSWTAAEVYRGQPFSFTPPDAAAEDGPTTRRGDAGEHTRLLRDAATLYLAFYDRAEGSLRLVESADDGATWSSPTTVAPAVVDGSRNVGQWPSMLIDDGRLTIAYHDVGNQDLVVATRTDAGAFESVVVDAGEFVGADSELVRRGGTLQVVYFDGQTNDMRLATRTGSTWTRERLGGETSPVGFHNEVVRIGDRWLAMSYDFQPRNIFTVDLTELAAAN